MKEQLTDTGEQVERLRLADLQIGETVIVITGANDQVWRYSFTVKSLEEGWPRGILGATTPDDLSVSPVPFTLHGAGNWTTRRQNPVQTQDRGFTSYWDSLYKGGCMVGVFDGQTNRVIFDQPGQEITDIILYKS